MLTAVAFLAGLALAGYGVARWFREREDALLAEIGAHYERRQQLMMGRIEEGDQALLAAYADLDRLEQQKSLVDLRLAEARAELDAALAARSAAEQALERRQAALATAEVQLELARRQAEAHGEAQGETVPSAAFAYPPEAVGRHEMACSN
ncbi:hypothetical protein [Geminicoccus roseus]|uniref:hypothetical protein n=1 Tax=Geminicoccus roseus TaxID=404900 RepID=UPI000415D871|nr:hypothetical protein [Geminicoccus roseus]